MPRFPVAFQPPAFASWAVRRPLGISAFLTVGLPDRNRPGPQRGYHFHLCGRIGIPEHARQCRRRPLAYPSTSVVQPLARRRSATPTTPGRSNQAKCPTPAGHLNRGGAEGWAPGSMP